MDTRKIKIPSLEKPMAAVLAEAAAWLLTFLFVYTAVSKAYDWQGTRMAMYNQLFPDWMADILLILLPLLELGTAVLLLVPNWRKTGFLLSLILLILFTGYVAYVWVGMADRVPCSCGGVLGSLGWGEHLVFNLFFLILALAGLGAETAVRKRLKNEL